MEGGGGEREWKDGARDVVGVGFGDDVCSCVAGATVTFAAVDRLVGLVVKASASRAEDPGFESRLRRYFFGVESYQ